MERELPAHSFIASKIDGRIRKATAILLAFILLHSFLYSPPLAEAQHVVLPPPPIESPQSVRREPPSKAAPSARFFRNESLLLRHETRPGSSGWNSDADGFSLLDGDRSDDAMIWDEDIPQHLVNENTQDRLSAEDTIRSTDAVGASQASFVRYDAIIVGGGVAGCPLARTLAEVGKKVLLIERGGARVDHPQTLDIYGAGVVVDNPAATQLIATRDGVRSHLGTLLSGGSAVNMGIVISDGKDYIDYLEKFDGVHYDRKLLNESMAWTMKWAAHPMPETLPYGARWRRGLELVYGPNRGYSPNLKLGTSWHGASIFDSKNNWFRTGTDVTLGIPGRDFPPTLHVLLRHNVHRVIFEESDKKADTLRATCVEFSPTIFNDIAPIGEEVFEKRLQGPGWRQGTTTKTVFSAALPARGAGQRFRACVKPGGQVILSAGAIMSPIILFKSGVGPVSSVINSGATVVKEIPELGRNLHDRVFIPLGLFFKGDLPPSGFPPRICQDIAIRNVGPHCKGFKMGIRSTKCTTVTAEELSGARIAEGTIYATRYIVPPVHREDPVMDALFQLLRDCAEDRAPFGKILLKSLCPLARPITNCFRKVTANLYFTATPQSVGYMEVLSSGEVAITGNYLTEPQDLEDAMRGVAHIIEVVNSGVYDDILEPAGLSSCPATILNGILAFIDNQMVKSADILTGMSKTDDATAMNATTDSGTKSLQPPPSVEKLRRFLTEQLEAFETQRSEAALLRQSDNGSSAFAPLLTQARSANRTHDDGKEMEGAAFNILGRSQSRRYWTSQRYATYPPVIPEVTDEEGLKRFAKTWMTSMWHWIGSASMGIVTDSDFGVKGFENLRIVDASVLNQLTRMNPFLFIMSLGRYAGRLLLQNPDIFPPSST